MRALLVRLSSIGDVVHTLPTLAALNAHGWRAGWLAEPPARPLLEGNPQVERTFAAPPARAFKWGEARATLRALRAERFDAALDLQGLWKSAAWARLSGAPRVVGYARSFRREGASALLMSERAAGAAEAVHVIDKNLALLRALGIEAVGTRAFPLPPAPDAAERVDAQLRARGLGAFVVLNPGGGWASKLWPAERFGALARVLRAEGHHCLVTWGPGEEALAERVVAAADGSAQRCFATTLLEYVALARRARLVVAADTGPMHLAAAVGTPVVALFGPTDPARNGPFASSDVVVREVPPCAPCYRRRCPHHEGVMDRIDPGPVAQAVARRLAGVS